MHYCIPMSDTPKQNVESLLLSALDKFIDKDLDEAAAIAKKFKWVYYGGKGKYCSKQDLQGCVSSLVYASLTQYRENVQKGTPYKPLSLASGRFCVRVDFWDNKPFASIVYGLQEWAS